LKTRLSPCGFPPPPPGEAGAEDDEYDGDGVGCDVG
jgi:hypothetical protein